VKAVDCLWASALALVAGCLGGPHGGGTGVGNPGTANLTTAVARHASISAGQGTLTAIELTRCSTGAVKSVSVDQALDLLASGPLDVNAGKWCDVSASFASPLTYSGVTETGATFELTLDVARVEIPLAKALEVDGNSLVAELGYPGWVNASVLGNPLAGQDVQVEPGSELHEILAARIAGGSALYDDDNDNGEVDDDERYENELGEGPDHEDENDTSDDDGY
jgi:hypothetical protein